MLEAFNWKVIRSPICTINAQEIEENNKKRGTKGLTLNKTKMLTLAYHEQQFKRKPVYIKVADDMSHFLITEQHRDVQDDWMDVQPLKFSEP